METYEEAQKQIGLALVLARSMADVIAAARESSMDVLQAAASDLVRAGNLVGGSAACIKRLREKKATLSTTAELIAKATGETA